MGKYFGSYNERFTLVDTDGVLGTAGQEYPIREPESFGEQVFKIEADEKWRTFLKEFSTGELTLNFDKVAIQGELSPYEIIKAVLDENSYDGNLYFRAYRTPKGENEKFKEWRIVLESVDKDTYSYKCRVKKVQFNDRLRTRLDTPVNVESTEDLYGNLATNLVPFKLPFHSQGILQEYEANYLTEIGNGYDASVNSFVNRGEFGTGGFMEVGWINIVKRSIDINIPQGFSWKTFDELNFYQFESSGVLNVDIEINTADGLLDQNTGWENPENVILKIISDEGDVDYVFNRVATSDQVFTSTSVEFTLTEEITVQEGDRMYIYFTNPNDAEFSQRPTDLNGTKVIINDFIDVQFLSYDEAKLVEGNWIKDVLNNVVQKIIGDDTYSPVLGTTLSPIKELRGDITVSSAGISVGDKVTGATSGAVGTVTSITSTVIEIDNIEGYFVDGENLEGEDSGVVVLVNNFGKEYHKAGGNFITSGNKLRQREKGIITTFEQLADFLRVRYNFGFVVLEINSKTYVQFEEIGQFFQNEKILTIESPLEVRETINKDLIYNQLQVGYKKFAEPNEKGSFYGFNTERSYATPAEKIRKTLELTTDVITDGSEIERVKRLDKQQDESDKTDDDIYAVRVTSLNQFKDRFDNLRFGALQSVESFDKTIILKGFYLQEGILDGVSTITVGVNSVDLPVNYETYTITNINYNTRRNFTTITIEEDVVFTGDFPFYEFYFDKDVRIPERLEGSTQVTGVFDKTSVYNLHHLPSNMVINWFNWYGGSFYLKPINNTVKVTKTKNNAEVSTPQRDKYTANVSENFDYSLNILESANSPIFNTKKYEVICLLDWDTEYVVLEDSVLGLAESGGEGANYGYIEFNDYDGQLVKAYPVSIEYETAKLQVKITCYGKIN